MTTSITSAIKLLVKKMLFFGHPQGQSIHGYRRPRTETPLRYVSTEIKIKINSRRRLAAMECEGDASAGPKDS